MNPRKSPQPWTRLQHQWRSSDRLLAGGLFVLQDGSPPAEPAPSGGTGVRLRPAVQGCDRVGAAEGRALVVLALLVGVLQVGAGPRQVIVGDAALVERDQNVGAIVAVPAWCGATGSAPPSWLGRTRAGRGTHSSGTRAAFISSRVTYITAAAGGRGETSKSKVAAWAGLEPVRRAERAAAHLAQGASCRWPHTTPACA